MEAGKERLTRDAIRDATRHEIEHIERDNADLKHVVADLSLEVYRLKKTAIPLLIDSQPALPGSLKPMLQKYYICVLLSTGLLTGQGNSVLLSQMIGTVEDLRLK